MTKVKVGTPIPIPFNREHVSVQKVFIEERGNGTGIEGLDHIIVNAVVDNYSRKEKEQVCYRERNFSPFFKEKKGKGFGKVYLAVVISFYRWDYGFF
jgi:hypothetical protein